MNIDSVESMLAGLKLMFDMVENKQISLDDFDDACADATRHIMSAKQLTASDQRFLVTYIANRLQIAGLGADTPLLDTIGAVLAKSELFNKP